jgi:hypothetical protein
MFNPPTETRIFPSQWRLADRCYVDLARNAKGPVWAKKIN